MYLGQGGATKNYIFRLKWKKDLGFRKDRNNFRRKKFTKYFKKAHNYFKDCIHFKMAETKCETQILSSTWVNKSDFMQYQHRALPTTWPIQYTSEILATI